MTSATARYRPGSFNSSAGPLICYPCVVDRACHSCNRQWQPSQSNRSRVCPSCKGKQQYARSHPRVRVCVGCAQEFAPSSRHRNCPSCRSVARMRTCQSGCGSRIRAGSTWCRNCLPQRVQSGDRNPNWKGDQARFKRSNGYVYVRVSSHPRGRNSRSYVFEHIIVMESVLGRYLESGENVHHKNGVRDDNRPENLELWVKPQPTGCRVDESVGWAVEILSRYAPEKLRSLH
jgi:hypothetical protein